MQQIVIDVGGYSFKAGMAGEELPFGHYRSIYSGEGAYRTVGGDAFNKSEKVESILERGEIVNWDAFQTMVDFIYKDLKKKPDEQAVLITTHPSVSTDNAKKHYKLCLKLLTSQPTTQASNQS